MIEVDHAASQKEGADEDDDAVRGANWRADGAAQLEIYRPSNESSNPWRKLSVTGSYTPNPAANSQ